MTTDEMVGDQSYSYQTAWGWVPACRRAELPAAEVLEPAGRELNAGNLCLTTNANRLPPFNPSIHLLRCACCVKCKAAPPYSLIDAMHYACLWPAPHLRMLVPQLLPFASPNYRPPRTYPSICWFCSELSSLVSCSV